LPEGWRPVVEPLLGWRRLLSRLGLLGRDPGRYGGYAYGNLSIRAPERGFLVTASQTSDLEEAGLEHLAWVEDWSLDANEVASRGLRLPSSEALTHAALYELSPGIGAVFHVHDPLLFQARHLALPATPETAEAGTVAMARALQGLWPRPAPLGLGSRPTGVVRMEGHEDGVLAFGATAAETGRLLLTSRDRAVADFLGLPPGGIGGQALVP
jgi:hypothetical protein